MEHLDHLSDEQSPVPEKIDGLYPDEFERAEQEGDEMAARGLIKVTQNGSRLVLLKGKPADKPYDGPMDVDL